MSYFPINQIKHLKNNYSDSYLNDYENLDLLNTKQSFFQDGKSFNSFIKSKYLYFKNSSFYKNISKDEDTPEEIIKVIHNKLKSEELKNILEAYKNIKNTNLQEYIIFSKNTLYMLCAPRLNIDEATQEELEQIVWNINSKDILAYNGKTKIKHNIKEEKVYKTVFNAYIKDNQSIESSANTSAVFDENLQIITNLRIEKDYPNSEDDLYVLKADTINVKNGYEFELDLNILDYNKNSLATKRDKSKSIDGLIEYKFTLKDLKKEFGLETIAYVDGAINEWK